MAEDLLGSVERLQARISENQEPRKLLKTLKRLGELPMTVDILVETGVGKSVNSLRKHEIVGEAAKALVAKWKKLVPQSVDRPSGGKEGRTHTRGSDGGRKRARDPSPEERSHIEEEEEDEEEREYQPGYSPSPPHHHYSPPHSHTGQRAYHSEEYESPPREEEPAPSPPRKKNKPPKLHKDVGREQSSHADREPERHRRHGDSAQGTGGGSEGKKRRTEREQQDGATHKPSKHRHAAPHGGREVKTEKKGGNEGRSREQRDTSDAPRKGEDEEDEAFEAPTMSFESFLTYDAPAPSKKKKKPPRPSHSSQPPAATTTTPPAPSAPSKANGTQSKRPARDPTPPVSEKRRKVVDVVPTLPDIPLPAIQPNYRPLPSIDFTPLSPQRRKVPVSCEEEDAVFTGRRFNSKMTVYSGSKTVYLPKMMTLYEQCIRVLQNNIDSIDEVGGVPYEILEPVLERCTPEQLYRIEQCNQCFMEDSDELWMRHCQRDFKRESPQEYESWREMYLRLHEEREERLRMLTQNISSAHANRPKGRQVKMAYVNSVAKPPRDVRRRQEKFGTTSGASSSMSMAAAAAAPAGGSSVPRIRPAISYSSQPSDPAPSSRATQSSAGGHSARDKPQVKKIAPMMAKTIKAFKNRFSRR
ncbi:elongin-A [Megalops cyprinoides]|uniref:elongin-A n=1 Tax=Megalops cyprinoides TaxID=118141 RepID=UPI0018643352|nr:elongin-A [Megalops cyprinoides]